MRFANAPPATIVDDRRDVPRPPARRITMMNYYGYMSLFERRVTYASELHLKRRALGTNSLDEVPDSTWFTNRSGLTPAQVRTGPVTEDNPEQHVPWTIVSTKFGGTELGFIIKDARGVKFVLKFDDLDHPEIETGVDVVVDRLLWASGYNVPEDQISYIRPDQLILAPDAVTKDSDGHAMDKLRQQDVDKVLALIPHEPDGRIRGSTSRWIEGTGIGAHPTEGVRKDDPNDLIPHERRRDLRGMFAMYSWVDNVDVWPGNFLDSWIVDPGNPKRHYVKHFALDFGRGLGAMAAKEHDLSRSHVYRFDFGTAFANLYTIGIEKYEWETRPQVQIRGVASTFTAAGFDPGQWHSDQVYMPFYEMDRYDGFWGAKIVARFTRDQIRAAVEAGRYSDPLAVQYITDTLVARQRKLVAYWYNQVSPLDRFAIGSQLCFDDLAITQGYVAAGTPTHYAISVFDKQGRAIAAPGVLAAALDGHTCMQAEKLGSDPDAYTIFQITTVRPDFQGTTYVHVARDYGGALRVVGIWRV
ncbi:MAG TPA: hypothetical protein VMJ10_16765 [Kofleriaceae bacterium]|nr:hypothetical protein [Kofleriaceae bacterium]